MWILVEFDSLGPDRLFWAANRSHVGNFVFLPLSERARQHRNSGDVPTNKEEHFRAQSPLILTFPDYKGLAMRGWKFTLEKRNLISVQYSRGSLSECNVWGNIIWRNLSLEENTKSLKNMENMMEKYEKSGKCGKSEEKIGEFWKMRQI